jgi:transglutaminase-like putative cysteine protease
MWFGGETETLSVRVAFSVETLRANPYDYIVTDPLALRLPMRLEGGLARALSHYRTRVRVNRDVDRFAQHIAAQASQETIPFLTTLNAAICERSRKVIREEGPPMPPEQTLAERTGSCRDLTVLFNDVCRAVGIPARFVSGYWHAETEREKRHMHAWAEVYLPGGGWRGFDPSYGLAVADEHLAVAASSEPSGAAPITGTFRGTGAEVTMDTHLKIHYD